MKAKRIVIGVLLAVVSLKLLAVAIAAVSVYVLDRTNGTIVSSGQERKYLLYVPKSYDPAKPTPLVISLHAFALWPAAQREISGWNTLADEHGFIVVYPAGTGMLAKMWRMEPEEDLLANVGFIADLIDNLEATYNIDATRIYANGFSNGGGMSFVLACALSDRLAAIGTVAAAQVLPWSRCAGGPPMPVIVLHGDADRIVPYTGGPSAFFDIPFPSVPDWTRNWARRNRCAPEPAESTTAADVSRIEYTNCAEDAAVVLYTVRGGGHSWPGGKPLPEWMVGSTTRNVNATGEMWAFFRKHQRRENQPHESGVRGDPEG